MNTTTSTTEITARAKAFSGEGIREHKFSIAEDGTVRVCTTCHSLSAATQTSLRKLAANE